jgi:D-3-phosphoglycerate dehydrogenase
MKKGAYFVNTARGGVADYEVLYRHLACGRLGGAGLDVFAQEPLIPKDLCRLADLPNVIVTPHTASNRFETRLSMAYLSCYALMTWLLGYRPTCIANPEVFV